MLSFQDMIQLCFSLMKRVSLPQTACSSALLSLCWKDFLIPTQNASSSGQVRGCLSHLQRTWRSRLGSLQAEDEWGLECLGKVFFICLLCFLTSPDIHFGAVREVILGGKLLVWCSIDIFRRQNPVYCVLLHNSLFCPQGVLLMLLCSRLHNSNFFNFPSQDRTSDLSSPSSELPLVPTTSSWGHITHSWTQGCSRVTGSTGDHRRVNPYILQAKSPVRSHRVFALLCSGSAQLTHAALWFTLDPCLQSCYPDTCSSSHICAAGYSHLSEGKRVSVRMYVGATCANRPELSTAWYNLKGLCWAGRVGRKRMQKDKMSVFPKFKTC